MNFWKSLRGIILHHAFDKMECNEHRDSLGNVPFVVRGEDNDNVARCLSFSCRLSEAESQCPSQKGREERRVFLVTVGHWAHQQYYYHVSIPVECYLLFIQVVDDRSIGLPMLRPMHRPMPSADGTIGFFQTIGRWISLKKYRFSEKMAERNLVWEKFRKSKNGITKFMFQYKSFDWLCIFLWKDKHDFQRIL